MSIETVRIKDLEEVSVNDIEQMWVPVDSATPDSTNKVKLSAFAAYVGGISDGKYIPLVGSTQITGSLVPSVADAALGSGSHKWLSLFAGGVHASDLLAIPQAAPSDPDPLESYLYCNASGNYAETPSGGVANIYDLTIRRGSVSAGTYNLGEQAADINLSSLFSGYATESWVSANFNNYTLPTASSSTKGGIKVGSSLSISNEVLNVLSGSIASNNTGYVTGGDIYSYINAIMSSSMKNIGESSTEITNGGSETPTINGSPYTPNVNDVVFYNSKEFVWTSLSKWRELGDESSFALKTTSISAGTGLTGGGTLSEDRTISLSTATQTSLGKADTAYQKPSGGIPKTDLASGVQTSLGLADSALQTSSMKALTLVVGSTTIGSDYNALSAKTYTISKTNLTDTLESSSGYYVKKSGDTMTGDLTFDASSDAKNIYWKKSDNNIASAVKMTSDGHLYYGMQQLSYGKETNIYGKVLRLYWNTSSATRGFIFAGDTIQPTPNGVVSLGISSYRFSALYSKGANLDTFLAIPQSAPSTSASWYSANDSYLWCDTTGNYTETPSGGGGGGGETLTITKNSQSWLSYNGSTAVSLNLVVPTALSDLTDDSTHRLVTDTQITSWTGKYTKPSGGIPSTDLATAYLPLAGGTLTGPLIVTSTSAGNYNEGIRLTRASNSWVGITFGSTGTSGMATDGWFAATNPSKQFIIAAGDSASTSGLCLNKAGDAKWRDNVILHAGNYSLYALPLSGGTLSHTNTSTQVLKLSTTNALATTLNFDTGGSATGRIETYKSDYSYGVVIQNLAVTGTPYVNIASDGKFKYNNTYEFYHTNNLTKSVLTGLLDASTGTYVPKKDSTNFYPYIGSAAGSIWYKVTLAHNGQGLTANRWWMLAMDLVLSSSYGTAAQPTRGVVHLMYYFYYGTSNSTFTAYNVKGMFTGVNYPNVIVKYDISNPAIFYVKTSALQYTTLAIENLMSLDSAASYDYTTTTIEAIAEANIPSTATTVVPVDSYLPLSGGTISASAANGFNIDNIASGGTETYMYFKVGGTNKMAVGYSGFAFIQNEGTHARIGVADNGKPQYWSSSSSSTAKEIWHEGNLTPGDYLLRAGGTMTGANPINFTENKLALDFRPNSSSYYTRVVYSTNQNEALMLSTTNANTSLIFNCGTTISSSSVWNSVFSATAPATMQLKQKSVYINSFIPSGTNPSYNLLVSGKSYLPQVEVDTSLAIPTSAPSNPASNKHYIWCDTSGSYTIVL